jgi:hypothetical protein
MDNSFESLYFYMIIRVMIDKFIVIYLHKYSPQSTHL